MTILLTGFLGDIVICYDTFLNLVKRVNGSPAGQRRGLPIRKGVKKGSEGDEAWDINFTKQRVDLSRQRRPGSARSGPGGGEYIHPGWWNPVGDFLAWLSWGSNCA